MAFDTSFIITLKDRFSSIADKVNRKIKKITISTKKASRAFKNLGKSIGGVGKKFALFATLPIVALGNSFINAAIDAEETRSRFEFVFKDVGRRANKAAIELAKSFNFSKRESEELIANLGDFTQNLGFSQAESLKLSVGLNQLAADVASFKNVQGGAKQVSLAFQSALVGERESLKTLGVAILETDVKNKILQLSQQGVKFESLKQAKVLATVALLQENFASSVGDLARTSKSAANQIRELTARFDDQRVALGNKLLPIKLKIVQVLIKLIDKFSKLDDNTKNVILIVVGLVAVLGPLLIVIGFIASGVSVLIPLFAGLTLAMVTAALPFIALAAVIGFLFFKFGVLGDIIKFIVSVLSTIAINAITLPFKIIIGVIDGIIVVGKALMALFTDGLPAATNIMKNAFKNLANSIISFFSPVTTLLNGIKTIFNEFTGATIDVRTDKLKILQEVRQKAQIEGSKQADKQGLTGKSRTDFIQSNISQQVRSATKIDINLNDPKRQIRSVESTGDADVSLGMNNMAVVQ